MEALPRLEARISSLTELRDIIRALRAMAASHVQEAQGALPGVRRYVEVVEDAIAEGAALFPEVAQAFVSPAGPFRDVLIVICSEHGFVGAFNEHLIERAEQELAAHQELIVIGTRGAALATEHGNTPLHSYPMATHVGGVLTVTRQIAEHLTGAGSATVIFGSYLQGGNFDIEVRPILPLDPALMVGSKRRSPPIHHLSRDLLLDRLAAEYLFGEVTHAVMESLASENGARLRAMETADHNIGDRLEHLSSSAHVLRQEAITSELLDVVVGSEAILESETP